MSLLHEPIEKEIKDIRSTFGCSQEDLAHTIGVTGRTIARWEHGESHPTHLAEEKILKLEKVRDKLLDVFEPMVAVRWLHTPNKAIGGRIPLYEMSSVENGIEQIIDILTSIEWGITS